MAQRADMLRGLSPRESSLALNYAAGPRGVWAGRPPPLGLALFPKDMRVPCGLAEAARPGHLVGHLV